MKLEKAVELLQGDTFDMEEIFWSKLGGALSAAYTLRVVDPETLLDDIGIDLDDIINEDELHEKIEDGLYNIMGVGSDGVEAY